MSKLGMRAGLPVLVCLLWCVGQSEGWLWWDQQTTAAPDPRQPHGPKPEPRRKGTSDASFGQRADAFEKRQELARISEAGRGLGSGVQFSGSVEKVDQGSGLGLGLGSGSGSSLGSGSAYGPESGRSIGEGQEGTKVIPTDLTSLTEVNAYVYTEGPTQKSDVVSVGHSQSVAENRFRQAEGHVSAVTDFPLTTDEHTRERLNVSAGDSGSSRRSGTFSSTASWHATNDNPTQYSSEYSVPVIDLLTSGSDNAPTLPTGATPRCLPLDSDLPFCAARKGAPEAERRFSVPNFLNHTSVEEVRATLSEWAWLLRAGCHHAVEWFFCLLLVPRCDGDGGSGKAGRGGGDVGGGGSSGVRPLLPSRSRLPCRSFCEVLVDSCWTVLPEGRLPVECHLLPEDTGADGGDDDGGDEGFRCLSVSNQKGNSGLECISPPLHPSRDAFS